SIETFLVCFSPPTMNEACAFEYAEALLRDRKPVEGVLAFPLSRFKKSARELSEPAMEVFSGSAQALERMLLSSIEKRTAQEFDASFHENFPKYITLTFALYQFAKTVVPEESLNRLTRESICELEADFRDHATAAFGAAIKEQVMFTTWTIRK